MNDTKLVTRATSGDGRALEKLLGRHSDQLVISSIVPLIYTSAINRMHSMLSKKWPTVPGKRSVN